MLWHFIGLNSTFCLLKPKHYLYDICPKKSPCSGSTVYLPPLSYGFVSLVQMSFLNTVRIHLSLYTGSRLPTVVAMWQLPKRAEARRTVRARSA